MAVATSERPARSRNLQRSIGFWGLLFISLGSIIGSGWLLGALDAASVAGPASLISWILATILLMTLALVHAELSTAYPVAGGTARFPYFAFGPLAGFTAGWAAYLQAVTIAPIEVEAALTYVSSTDWASKHFNMINANGTLNGLGLLVASAAMLVFTVVNLYGAKLLSDSNSVVVIWKFLVPILAIIVILSINFHGSNFHAGGGFAPFGTHGIFAALPAGVVFALQGFEQAAQMGGEARNPQKHLSRAIITAMLIGAGLYILLEVTFIGGLTPSHLANGWATPLGKNQQTFGAYYTLALAAGVGWLANLLLVDAVVSPSGTGLLYLGTSARVTYALGEEDELPDKLAETNKRGVPVWSIVLAFVIGELMFLPFPSWSSLVNLITEATAIMYAFAPVALTALRRRDGDRERPYKAPFPTVLSPVAFCSANLIMYWSGYAKTWRILAGIAVGLAIFFVARRFRADRGSRGLNMRNSMWIWPWLAGTLVIGFLGNYDGKAILPDWVDLAIVIVFSLVIFYWAVSLALDPETVKRTVEREEEETGEGGRGEDVNLPG